MREVPVEVGGVLSVTLFRRFLVLVLALIVLGMGAVSISAVQAAQSVQAKPKTPTRAELKAFKARAEQGDAGAGVNWAQSTGMGRWFGRTTQRRTSGTPLAFGCLTTSRTPALMTVAACGS